MTDHGFTESVVEQAAPAWLEAGGWRTAPAPPADSQPNPELAISRMPHSQPADSGSTGGLLAVIEADTACPARIIE